MMIVAAIVTLCIVSVCDAEMMMPCCTSMAPDMFSVGMQIVKTELKPGSMTPTLTMNQFVVDQDNTKNMTRYAGQLDTYTGMNLTQYNYTVINDYTMGKQYNFGVAGDGQMYCTVNMLDEMMTNKFCVPGNLTYLNTYKFGSGNESVMVNSWEGMADGMMWNMQTTVYGCEPVSYNKFGMTPDGTSMTESGLYGNAMHQLSTQNPFVVPTQCMSMTFNVGNFPG